MKILHVYPNHDTLIARHVNMLAEGLRQSSDIRVADNGNAFRQLLNEQKPDIVHCHGCRNYAIARAVSRARQQGVRIVITLHGQLEPWVAKQDATQEKINKALMWQKSFVANAYAVITLGRLEKANFVALSWSHRVEEIHNAVTTNTITPAEMCTRTFQIYQKIQDSNTLEQLDENSRQAFAVILKASILGDRQWVAPELRAALSPHKIDWRRLFVYAEHENIRNYIDYGTHILGLPTPLLDTSQITSYFPDQYERPRPIKELIGDYQGNETDYLLRIFRQIHRQPLLLHLIELTSELYRDAIDDEQITEALADRKLQDFAESLMQVLKEQTLLDEGFMPVNAVDNRQTRQIRKLLTNHLKI